MIKGEKGKKTKNQENNKDKNILQIIRTQRYKKKKQTMKPKTGSKKRLIKTKNLAPGNAQQGKKGGKNSNVTSEVGPGTHRD